MAQLLVSTKTGKIVTVQPDMHRWGRLEHKQEWTNRGGLEADWPDDFYVIKVPGRAYSALQHLAGRHFNLNILNKGELQNLKAKGEFVLKPWQLELFV